MHYITRARARMQNEIVIPAGSIDFLRRSREISDNDDEKTKTRARRARAGSRKLRAKQF